MLSDAFPGAPYSDNCRTCNDQVIQSPVGVVSIKKTNAVFGYACERGHRWTCGFALDPVWSHMLIQRDPGRFRDLVSTIATGDNKSLHGGHLLQPSDSTLMRMAFNSLVELWNRTAWQDAATPTERDAIDQAINLLGTATGEIAQRSNRRKRRPRQEA